MRTWIRLLAFLLAFGLIAAACGDDSGTTATEPAAEEPAPEPAEEAAEEPAEEPEEEEEAAEEEEMAEEEMVSLAGVCPSPFVIQSDWFPESEHGAVYNMMGDDYEVDVDQKSIQGTMVVAGEDMGIRIEIRAGGPAIGSQAVAAVMATDDDIALGFSATDNGILLNATAPVLSVVSPLDVSPGIVMWDPQGLPGVETIADLGELGTTIQAFGGGRWHIILAGLGVISEDQIDPSYDGSPARFVAEGDIAQQGFASAEPFLYEFQIPEYGRPVGFQLMAEAGYDVYPSALSVRADKQAELDECLKLVVPLIQQATVDFYASPDRANAIIIDAVEQMDTFWTYDADLAAYSVESQQDLGLAGNGSDDTVGNFDLERVQAFIDAARISGLDFSDDLVPEDVVTNEYIDESIGFP